MTQLSTTEKPGEPELAALRHSAERHVTSMNAELQKLVEGNRSLLEADQSWSSETSKLGWAGLFFMAFTAQLAFDDGTVLHFGGEGGGLSLGAGAVWGVLTVNVPPASLKGVKVNFQYNIGFAGVNVNFWNKSTGAYIGSFVGGGVSGGAGTGGGTGHF
jgi:hypothetical protein